MQATQESISISDAKRDLEEIVHRVVEKSDGVVISIDGTPQAAVVPMRVYMEWQQQRKQEAAAIMEAASARANMSEEEADELIAEAIQAVRREKRKTE